MNRLSNRQDKKYTKPDIVTMALCFLSGALHHVHLEDVAMKAAALHPKSFSWQKYPEQVNLESVRIALKHEAESKENRVVGSIREGWMLTPKGVSWCMDNVKGEQNQVFLNQIRRDIVQAKKSEAFIKIINSKSQNVTVTDLESFLRVDEYFTAQKRREKVIALNNAALLDPELGLVLRKLVDHGFKELEVTK